VTRLTDQEKLVDVAKTVKDPCLRIKIAKKISNRLIAQEIFVEISKNDKDTYAFDALAQVTDEKLLIDIMKNAHNRHIRAEATKKLPGNLFASDLFIDIAKNVNEPIELREFVVERLTDKKVLTEIINGDETYGEENVWVNTGAYENDTQGYMDSIKHYLRDVAKKRLAELEK
jgi:hypothetical protein